METESSTKQNQKLLAIKKISAAAEFLRAAGKPLVQFLSFVIPLLLINGRRIRDAYYKLPNNMLQFHLGFVFCFFGGLYPVLFAAIQAAEFGGRETLRAAAKDLGDETLRIIEESKKDDEVDDNKDGIADVTQISDSEYRNRKIQLVMKKMDPEKIDRAMQSMYSVWLSVAAVLTIEFARTISSALSIAEFLKNPVNHWVAPLVQMAVPQDYNRWVPVMLGWMCKSVAMSIAWYIQTIRSAFASALAGGLLMSKSTIHMLEKRGLVQAKDHSETYLDEILSYIFAACGFYFQFKLGFDVPYPFNLILFPFEIAEYYIRWSITSSA
mmetsp:Transcript_20099/g.22977  ORF Transcript_20099/g.22977 Transcript_20099/m.22977 type:complete len:325 (+) Transcript_20099:64-1038(+)